MRKLCAIAVAFAIVCGFLPAGLFAQTTDIQSQIDSVTKQRDQLLEEQKQLQSQLDALGTQSQTLQGNIKTLDATRTKLANDIKITQANISAANLTIQKLDQNITTNEREISDHESAIASAVSQLSAYDGHTLIYDLLTYNNIADVWMDQSNLSTLSSNLRQEIKDLNDAQIELTQNKASKVAQKSNLMSYQGELSGQKKVVESSQAAKQSLLNQTKSQEATYQALLANNKKKEAEFESLLFQYESQLKAASPGSAPSAEHSILAWPLAKIKVTQQFGKTSSSGRLYASGTHNGVDFGTPVGTPVMAPRQGTVKAQGNTDLQHGCYSYGRWILIEHDDGLSTIYGHLSATIVATGQTVTTGQVIGYSGGQPGADGAGYSTGPHLHFGLFVTAGVTVQQYTSSINCKNVSIPIANPTDYLDPLAYLPKL